MENRWDERSVPDLQGKTVLITGSNSGIGFEAARVLAGKGADVVLAVRNAAKGQTAANALRREHPTATVDVMTLDLSDLASVHDFAQAFRQRSAKLSLLINNAGVMAPPYRKTANGFEIQFGTNHLGHFALTGQLLPLLLATPSARVVNVSSAAHTVGKIDFDNLDGSKGYSRWRFYGQSKLANLLFTYELQRRFEAAKADVISVACHPGFAATNLTAAGVGMNLSWLGKGLGSLSNLAAQSAAMGALPTLYAATESGVHGGDFIGPTGRGGMKGYPGKVQSNERSHDSVVAKQLWQVSETLTGVQFDFNDFNSHI